jgi:hypothetical protein
MIYVSGETCLLIIPVPNSAGILIRKEEMAERKREGEKKHCDEHLILMFTCSGTSIRPSRTCLAYYYCKLRTAGAACADLGWKLKNCIVKKGKRISEWKWKDGQKR